MKTRAFQACVVAAVVAVGLAAAQEKTPAAAHVALAPADVKWGDPPPVLDPAARFAVVSGNPGGSGLFAIRLRMPAGYRLAPHWHPTDEHVTVLSGVFAVGMGERFETRGMKELPAGGYALLPADMRHFAMAKTDAVVQVHGQGPFVLNYVNPADDPSRQKK